ncbi:MAG: DUF6017 domain-containing protein [Butyrivibrio sp.]
MDSGFFRKKTGYTVVQNSITQDLNVSLKAKGLYLVIQSNITLPNKKWCKKDFKRMTCEGNKAFESAWNELKEKGYLHVHMYSNGHTWTVEYELLDEAEPRAHTFYYNSKGELTRTNLDKLSQKSEKQILEPVKEDDESRIPQKGGNGSENGKNSRYPRFGIYGNGSNGKGGNNNINTNNNTLYINKSINQSIYTTGQSEADEDRIDGFNMTVDDITPEVILENLEYDLHMQNGAHGDKELYAELCSLVCDTICCKRDTVRIGDREYPHNQVKSKFLQLNSGHLEYIVEVMKKQHNRIHNIRAYMLTSLYNAPDTINHYYQALVQADMAGG